MYISHDTEERHDGVATVDDDQHDEEIDDNDYTIADEDEDEPAHVSFVSFQLGILATLMFPLITSYLFVWVYRWLRTAD